MQAKSITVFTRQALVPLFRALSDDDWDRIREHLRSKGD
jgi:hypothetical protein